MPLTSKPRSQYGSTRHYGFQTLEALSETYQEFFAIFLTIISTLDVCGNMPVICNYCGTVGFMEISNIMTFQEKG